MEKGENMKKIFGIIAFLSFMYLLGTVGAVEQNMMPFGTGVIRMIVSFISFGLFTWLAGGFDYSYTFNGDKESRPRCSRPKGGKHKNLKTVYHKGGKNAIF